jgi:branched-chain amino acid transport system substrate-binding protein
MGGQISVFGPPVRIPPITRPFVAAPLVVSATGANADRKWRGRIDDELPEEVIAHMKLRYLGVFGAALMLAAACSTGGGTTTPAPTSGAATPGATTSGTTAPEPTTGGGGDITAVKIGVDLPLSGGEVANGQPTLQGVELAVKEWNEGDHAYTVELNVQDDALNGVHDPQTGANNANTLTADEQVVGMVGPFNSNVARAIIPITNEFGLAQCSPANTAIDLTKEGSEEHRPVNPDVRNYFRVATPDDVQGPAGAQYAYNDLGARAALVIDDTEAFGVGVANSFSDEFEALGGTIVQRQSNDFEVNQSFAGILDGVPGEFDVVYFGGTQVTGGGQLRRDMGGADLLDIPFVGPDGTTDLGAGGAEGTMITLAGVENSDNVHGTVAGANALEMEAATDFNAAYEAEFGTGPGAYSALAYMCTQILLQAIDSNIGSAADLAALREAVRASVFAGDEWDTILGPIQFDDNGDSSQKWISFYKVDVTLNEGAGGWVFVRQQDFSLEEPAPGGSPGAESPGAESPGAESPGAESPGAESPAASMTP